MQTLLRAEDCALILLAAGRSQRFGLTDKLAEHLHGMPLALHAVAALAELPFAARFAVRSGTALDFARHGYAVLQNDDPAAGMARSLGIGIAAARGCRCDAALVVLADMPCVTAAHVRRLLDVADGADAVVGSSDGVRASPPAVLGRDRFEALLALHGDTGARDIVNGGRLVVAGAGELRDIDRPEDLERLRAAG